MSLTNNSRRFSFLDFIEWLGNKLPEPATLFILCALTVMILSDIGAKFGWSVRPSRPRMQAMVDLSGNPVLDDAGKPRMEVARNSHNERPMLEKYGEPIRAVSLLTKDGAYWAISNMVNNFVRFPPLGIILTAVLGVGVAERSGLIAAALKALAMIVPNVLLTPTIIFLGINATITSDAAYVVLPPAAAVLYAAAGRSPIVGIAVACAGVAGGFSANLLITASDAMMAGFTETAARIMDPKYTVAATCNWYFMIAATFVLSIAGWIVTALFVEPRFRTKPAQEGGPAPVSAEEMEARRLTKLEIRGMAIAAVTFAVILGLIFAAIFLERGPLYGREPDSSRVRWIQSIVPIIFVSFIIPGIVYGIVVGKIRREKDVTELLVDSMKSMAAIIVVYFFAAQFIEYFKYSNLGRMLSIVGGEFLATSDVSIEVLLVLFILLTIMVDFVMSSMSAKYAVMSPIFVPMLMMVGISPELTQASYRLADSVTNNIGPLNPYQVIILKEMQKYAPKSGLGTLISTNLPYSIIFAIAWSGLLLVWIQTGFPLGQGGPLHYVPSN